MTQFFREQLFFLAVCIVHDNREIMYRVLLYIVWWCVDRNQYVIVCNIILFDLLNLLIAK